MINFELAPKLSDGSEQLASWSLCDVLFKNELHYAWFLLVPRRVDISELMQLSSVDQQQLTLETAQLSALIKTEFNPDKLNIASIGNQVPQLHVHVVGRFKTDPLWPAGIWQPDYQPCEYSAQAWQALIHKLKNLTGFKA
jgi:diadenosine tetraphosphate (Ap4A) HIT family hydrolase